MLRMISTARMARRIWRSPYRKVLLGVGITGAAVSAIPAAFNHFWLVWIVMVAVTVALIANRWRKASQAAKQSHTQFKAKNRAQVIMRSLRPVNYSVRTFAIAAFIMGFGSKLWMDYSAAKNDELSYLNAQVLHAVAVAPTQLKRAIELEEGASALSNGGDFCKPAIVRERKLLINNLDIPDVIRATMLRVDARCEHELGNEVTVAEDVRRIHDFRFMIGNRDIAAIADAFFTMHDYEAGVILARSSTPAARVQLRQIAQNTHDPRLRHAIRIALAD